MNNTENSMENQGNTIRKSDGSAGSGRKSRLNISYMAKVGILSAIAVLIMLFEIPLPFAPSFYELDLSETVILIGGFALGPLAGVIIEFIKVLLNLVINGTVTAGIGELANFIMGCSLVVPASLMYRHKKTLKNAILGMTVGTVCLTVVGSLTNLFVLLPVYAAAFHMPLDALIEMGTKVNGWIVDLPTLVLFATAPFNLLKGVVCSLLAGLLYKRLSSILHR